VTPEILTDGLLRLGDAGTDAVIGMCPDGGYWSIGLTDTRAAVFAGVPMSTSGTGSAQLERMRQLGMRVRGLPELRDVDHFSDALAVADDCPGGRFGRKIAELGPAFA
jgi:glycosyltransferase A (GT-A) superfamily protein (DUF2064 family)